MCMYVCKFVTRSPYSLSSHEARMSLVYILMLDAILSVCLCLYVCPRTKSYWGQITRLQFRNFWPL